ncbi:OmpA family protein [Burkholderia pyrrocinia]|uniref:OmpA-like domain-containing protein n=1 Tax=Burkholderia pyrrocinia TaxID=60550 RepID=A0ABZ3BSN1_BURPY
MHKFLIAILLAASDSASACIASENFDIYFNRDDATISNSEIIRVANWVTDQNIDYANHTTKETTLISGHAEEDERGAQALAQSRLQAGRALLEQLGFLRGTIRASVRVYSRGDVDNGRRVEISFLPDCPNKCCTGK